MLPWKNKEGRGSTEFSVQILRIIYQKFLETRWRQTKEGTDEAILMKKNSGVNIKVHLIKRSFHHIWNRRQIRLIEGNAECHKNKRLTWKGTLRQMFICLRPRIPYPPHTLYTCIQHTYSHRKGEESSTREKVRGATAPKSGLTIPTWLIVYLVYNSDNSCCVSPFTGTFFNWWHFALLPI